MDTFDVKRADSSVWTTTIHVNVAFSLVINGSKNFFYLKKPSMVSKISTNLNISHRKASSNELKD